MLDVSTVAFQVQKLFRSLEKGAPGRRRVEVTSEFSNFRSKKSKKSMYTHEAF